MHQHRRLNAGLSENGIPNRVIESDLFTSISVDQVPNLVLVWKETPNTGH